MTGRLHWLGAPAVAGVFLCAALLAGCATPQVARLDAHWPPDLAVRVELENVPFFPQEDYECGPASLAMVAGAAGVQVLPQALVEQVYLPGRQGSLQPEMLAATRRQGLVAYPLSGQIEAVLREVAAGHPVLVFQNLAFSFSPVWHYAVVIGFDRGRNLLLLHSGRSARMEMSLFAFERTWARGQNWAMVALPPSRLPATAQAHLYTASVATLERINPKAAKVAYLSALQAWPKDRTALLGVGNASYALGERGAATQAYQTAVRQHPDFAEAWNNLAQVLWEQKQRREAAQAIAKAIELGGPRLPQYQALQHEIMKK